MCIALLVEAEMTLVLAILEYFSYLCAILGPSDFAPHDCEQQ